MLAASALQAIGWAVGDGGDGADVADSAVGGRDSTAVGAADGVEVGSEVVCSEVVGVAVIVGAAVAVGAGVGSEMRDATVDTVGSSVLGSGVAVGGGDDTGVVGAAAWLHIMVTEYTPSREVEPSMSIA